MFKLKRYMQIAFILKYSVICQRHDSRVLFSFPHTTTILLQIVYYSSAVVYGEIEYIFVIVRLGTYKICKYIMLHWKYQRHLYSFRHANSIVT